VSTLSPYLFKLVTNVFGYLLCNPIYGVHVLVPPTADKPRDQCFANDTTVYLEGTIDNLEKAIQVVSLFCISVGAKMNWRKPLVIWASKR
jgi:hypothetical protein